MSAMTDHEDQIEAAKQAGQIGYYNPHPYPISFSSTIAGRGLVEVGPGEPVLKRNGHLVAWDQDLEAQVGLQMLTKIVPNNPNYKKYQALNGIKDKQAKVYSAPAASVPVVNQAAANIAASQAERLGSGLPPGAVAAPNGGIAYEGRIFDSRAAFDTYLDSK
jgi:hypothetical protein